MPQGMQIYSETGFLINDTNDRFPRICGEVDIIGNTTGSIPISIPAGTLPIFFIVKKSSVFIANMPYITITSTLLSWEYRQYLVQWGTAPYANAKVMWGYY